MVNATPTQEARRDETFTFRAGKATFVWKLRRILQLKSVPFSRIPDCTFPLYVVSNMEPESQIRWNEHIASRMHTSIGHSKRAQKKQKSFVFVTLDLHRGLPNSLTGPQAQVQAVVRRFWTWSRSWPPWCRGMSASVPPHQGDSELWSKCQAADTKKGLFKWPMVRKPELASLMLIVSIKLNNFFFGCIQDYVSIWFACWMTPCFRHHEPYGAWVVGDGGGISLHGWNDENLRTLLKQLNWLAWGKQRCADES